jgi:hypothetical protein
LFGLRAIVGHISGRPSVYRNGSQRTKGTEFVFAEGVISN